MRKLFFAAAFAAFCASAAPGLAAADEPAPNPAQEGRDCFRSDDVSGFGVVDNDTIRVSVGANRDYLLSAPRAGRDARWNAEIGLRSTTDWICTGNGLGVDLYVHESFTRRFPVRNIVRAPDPTPASNEKPTPATDSAG